jgi:hypothetical protein
VVLKKGQDQTAHVSAALPIQNIDAVATSG